MMGIGHLLAEGEMQKEALSLQAKASLGLGVGVAGLTGIALLAERERGGMQAERDFHAGLAGYKRPFDAGFERDGYDKRLAELQQQGQQAA